MALRLAHALSQQRVGGIDRSFFGFLRFLATRGGDRYTLLSRRAMAPELSADVQATSAQVHRFGGIRLPRPAFWLSLDLELRLRRMDSDAMILWSNPGIARQVPGIRGRLTYYERGAGLFRRAVGRSLAGLKALGAIRGSSPASQRMLVLRWGLPTELTNVCPNAIRPECHPLDVDARALPRDRPLRVGLRRPPGTGRRLPVGTASLRRGTGRRSAGGSHRGTRATGGGGPWAGRPSRDNQSARRRPSRVGRRPGCPAHAGLSRRQEPPRLPHPAALASVVASVLTDGHPHLASRAKGIAPAHLKLDYGRHASKVLAASGRWSMAPARPCCAGSPIVYLVWPGPAARNA